MQFLISEMLTGFWLLYVFRLLASKYRPYGVYKDARTILVIHNLAHQVGAPLMFWSDTEHACYSAPWASSWWILFIQWGGRFVTLIQQIHLHVREWNLQQLTQIWDCLQSGMGPWDGCSLLGQGLMLLTLVKLLIC